MSKFTVAISVKLPDMRVFDGKLFTDAIAKAQRDKTGPAMTALLKKTTEGWEHKPDFSSKQRVSMDAISMTVQASGVNRNQFNLVSNGSPMHTISPKRGGLLVYQEGYRAATRPRILSSRAKVRFGPFVSTANKIIHPGFEAREFYESTAYAHYPDFVRDMQDVFNNPLFLGGNL